MNQGNWQSSWLGDSMAFNARKRTCLMMMMIIIIIIIIIIAIDYYYYVSTIF